MTHHRRLLQVLALMAILAMVFSACAAPVATPSTGSEAAPAEAAATEAPAEEAAPVEEGPFVPLSFAAPDCEYGGTFKSMEAVDQYTVKFTLCGPDVAFPAKVAFSAFGINDQGYLEETGGGGSLIDNPVGTGKYSFVEWRRGDQIILKANPDDRGDAAIPENLIIRWSTESAQRSARTPGRHRRWYRQPRSG